jgi:hypothetical protein
MHVGAKFGFHATIAKNPPTQEYVQRSVELEKFYRDKAEALPENTSIVRCQNCILLFPSVLDLWHKRHEYQKELTKAVDFFQSLDGLSFQGYKIEVKIKADQLIDDTQIQFWQHLGNKMRVAR